MNTSRQVLSRSFAYGNLFLHGLMSSSGARPNAVYRMPNLINRSEKTRLRRPAVFFFQEKEGLQFFSLKTKKASSACTGVS